MIMLVWLFVNRSIQIILINKTFWRCRSEGSETNCTNGFGMTTKGREHYGNNEIMMVCQMALLGFENGSYPRMEIQHRYLMNLCFRFIRIVFNRYTFCFMFSKV